MSGTLVVTCTRFEVSIKTPHEDFLIACLCHCSHHPNDRQIEEDFYETQSLAGVPQGTHHEMELMQEPWNRPGLPKLHIHLNPITRKKFVCWSGHLHTLDAAQLIFERWAVGTIYTMLTGKDFAPVVAPIGWDAFYSKLEELHGIKFKGTKVIN
jgi:hypothetical protein